MRPVPQHARPLASAGLALLALLACADGPAPTDAPAAAAPTPASAPNFLVVTLDTTRADALEPFGGMAGATPTAKRLAQEGFAFTRAYTVTPLTIPAHSSLHTGLYPPRHGVRDNGDFFLSEGAETLAEQLKAHGYETMASVGAEVTSHHWGFAQGFDAYFDDMGETTQGGNRWRIERPGSEVMADATAWLKQDRDAPWFAWVHLFDAHHPYEPSEPYKSRYPNRPYQAEIAQTDALVGELLDALGPEMDNTWVFVMADHGEGRGDHGESMHGVLLHDATTRIPLLVRPPKGRATPARVGFPVSIVDVAPSIRTLAGITDSKVSDGRDLSKWLQSTGDLPKAPTRPRAYVESLYAWHHYGWAPQRAYVGHTYKLIDSTTPQLYERQDRRESEDLAAVREPILLRLKKELEDWTATMAPMADAADRASLSAERLAQLEALGYMTTPAEEGGGDDIPWSGDLPDPEEGFVTLGQIEKVRQLVQQKKLDEAEPALRKLIAAHPALTQPHQLLASVLERQGRLDEALASVQHLDSTHPSSATKAQMGALQLRLGKREDAIALLGAALDIDPYLSMAWVTYLHALFLDGDPQRLATEVARAQEHLPDHSGVAGMAGLMMAMRGDMDGGAPLMQAALEDDPRLPFLNHGLGVVERTRNAPTKAEEHFLDEIRLHPPGLPSRRSLVELYVSQKRYDDQYAQLMEISKVEPPNPLTAHALAQSLFNLTRYDEALPQVERCRDMAPIHPECALLHANTLGKLGRTEEAKVVFQEAVALKEAAKSAPPSPRPSRPPR